MRWFFDCRLFIVILFFCERRARGQRGLLELTVCVSGRPEPTTRPNFPAAQDADCRSFLKNFDEQTGIPGSSINPENHSTNQIHRFIDSILFLYVMCTR